MEGTVKIASFGERYLWGVPEDPKGARVWVGTGHAPTEGPFNFQELLAHMPNIAEMEELTAYVAAVNCVAFHRAFDPILTEDMVAIYFPEGSPAPAEKIALIRPPSWDGERVVYCAKAKFLPAVPYRIVGPNEVGGFRGGPL